MVVAIVVFFLVITVNLGVFIGWGVFLAYFHKLSISFQSCSSKHVSFDLSKCLFQLFTFLVSPSLTFAFVLMFTLLPQLYPQDFVDFFIRNHFQFLEDVFHKCLDNSDIQPFYSAINSLDHDLKFIFEF